MIQTGQQNITYSFHDEFDNLVKEKRQEEFSQKKLFDQIGQIQYS
ncbi:unnamed protein product [Paramecium octaurelia]|uniref:Uncharacterized protein n=1 Tax=Paramecium octaurelia TaxID=43137 RepID=A0A8S1VL85_PAROT|nr:unnamed protein product [Paramecium octaurelia]